MSAPRGARYEKVGSGRDADDAVEAEVDPEQQELHEGNQPVVVVATVDDERVEAGSGEPAAAPEASAVVEPADSITVRVKSSDDKTHDVRVSASGSVDDLKAVLADLTGLPPDRQRLICLGKLLVDGHTLKQSNVTDGIFVHLVPKPASSGPPLARSSSGSSNSSRVPVAENVDEIHIPAHIRELLAARNSRVPEALHDDSRFSFEDEYELSIWRYRVRVMSMLMLFYYFMALMASLSLWMRPEGDDDEDKYRRGGQFRQVRSNVPLALVDTLENVLGIIVSIAGLKAAVRNCPVVAARFAREVSRLAVVHFCNLFMWIVALYRGDIVQVPLRSRHHASTSHEATPEEQEEAVRSIVGAMLIVHPLLWVSILSIAFRFQKILAHRQEVFEPPQAVAAQPSEAPQAQSGRAPATSIDIV